MSYPIEHLNQLVSRSVDSGSEPLMVDLWVPSETVLVFEQELPRVSKRKLYDMLPWMMEDRLLDSPESYEFVLGPQADSGTLVFAVERTLVSRWLMVADSSGVNPVRMVPDYFALPYEEGRWAVYSENGRLLVRTGLYTGFAAELETGWQQLQLLLAQVEEPMRLSFLQTDALKVPEALLDRLDTQTGKINWGFTELPLGIDILPANLKPGKQSVLTRWWPPIGVASLLVVFIIIFMLVQSWVWQRDIALLEEAVAEAYEQMFSEQLEGSAAEAADLASEQMRLMEHQYIQMQSSPMAEINSLDRIFSTCSECSLMALEQTDTGLDLRLKQTDRLKSRLTGVPDWNYSWSAEDEAGFSTLSVEPLR